MPIYEYKCTKCGKVSSFLKSINSDEKTEVCTECGGKSVRIISLSSFILKGSGWYATDYKRNASAQNPTKNEKIDKKEVKDTKEKPKEAKKSPAGNAAS
ncbi:MAG: zinc ribbon domain-containing protein [Deferribacterota bacterium]|nr:zinc ribbon domain-containing protein [Deferribacterota bacterium]